MSAVRTPRFRRSPAARIVPGFVESYAKRPESVTIATHSASAIAVSRFHSFHLAMRQMISPVDEALESTMETSAKEPSFVT